MRKKHWSSSGEGKMHCLELKQRRWKYSELPDCMSLERESLRDKIIFWGESSGQWSYTYYKMPEWEGSTAYVVFIPYFYGWRKWSLQRMNGKPLPIPSKLSPGQSHGGHTLHLSRSQFNHLIISGHPVFFWQHSSRRERAGEEAVIGTHRESEICKRRAAWREL